jgi:hypothetical protein
MAVGIPRYDLELVECEDQKESYVNEEEAKP